ncbi:MAG: hypothetical protein K2P81_11640 [Bacteriovoracaceae bacterium]|nr:hypothetical protein [Bacteriovoracaceae bacterium]
MKFIVYSTLLMCSLSNVFASGTLDFNVTAKDKFSADSKVLFNKDLKLRDGQVFKIDVPKWEGQANAQTLTYEISAKAIYSPTSIDTVIKAIVSDISGQSAQVISTKEVHVKVLPKNDAKSGELKVEEGSTKFHHELVITTK